MAQGDLHRWLYRGWRFHWLARPLNRIWAWLAMLGVAPGYLATLEVVGRKSGRVVALPVVIVVVDGERYLVSMLGGKGHWARNVRAAAGKVVLRSGGREEVRLEELPVELRAPILKAYLRRAPGARPHFPVDQAAPLAQFEAVAGVFPVFRVIVGW